MLQVFKPFPEYLTTNEAISHIKPPKRGHTVEKLTRDVEVKPIHSHNDYWRTQPLFDALSYGCQSIESDIWLAPETYEMHRTHVEYTDGKKDHRNDISSEEVARFEKGEIYVGHSQIYLGTNLTLQRLYLDPLYSFLEYANPSFKALKGSHDDIDLDNVHSDLKNGVFFDSPESSLYFWMDFKTDADTTYRGVMPLLKRFIDKNYLAYYDVQSDKFVPGPIVITATGNAPVDLIEQETRRYVFVDAPLKALREGSSAETQKYSKLSVIASASLEELLGTEAFNRAKTKEFSKEDEEKLFEYFEAAHNLGLKTRVWGGINWPNYISKSHLKSLLANGCDLLNTDRLEEIAYML